MKFPFLALRLAQGMKCLSAAAVVLLAVAGSSHAITVNWNGTNTFNDAHITFTAFQANQLTDIYGSGLYEACCHTGSTDFTLKLKLNGTWTEVLSWSSSGDHTTHTLGDLVPPVINFALSWVSGIKLNSSPNGQSWFGNDYNFTGFNYIEYLSKTEYYSLYKHKYKDWDDFDRCRDYEDYVRHQTWFVFCLDCKPPEGPPPDPTPLPAALPLFATGLGAFGLVGWRRRWKRKVAN